MTTADLVALITAVAGLLTAAAAAWRAVQTGRQLQAHITAESSSIARAARRAGSVGSEDR